MRKNDAGRHAGTPARLSRHPTQPRQVWLIFTGAGLAIALALAAFLFSYRIEPPPGNARVVADEQRLTYASTPCVVFNKLDRELIANRDQVNDPSKPLQLYTYANEKTISDVKADPKWSRDAACDYVTGFDQIVTRWMQFTGYRSRWGDDGQWRW